MAFLHPIAQLFEQRHVGPRADQNGMARRQNGGQQVVAGESGIGYEERGRGQIA